jgi:hypothetical protein
MTTPYTRSTNAESLNKHLEQIKNKNSHPTLDAVASPGRMGIALAGTISGLETVAFRA